MNSSTALATVLVDELVRCGVREAVLCPGSRSAPLAYALEEADRQGRLRLHVRVDERSAGFLALGLAKLTRVPAVVVTTSGTAVANLHPAVLEADHADVPLLVLSADRPAELQGTGANQTTHQPGLFGAAPRWSAVVTAPEDPARQNAWWRATACRAWAAATGGLGTAPGPVHLDVQLREPLVPDAVGPGGDLTAGAPSDADADAPAGAPAGRADGTPWTAVAARPAGGDPDGARPAGARPWVSDDLDRAASGALEPSSVGGVVPRAHDGFDDEPTRTLVLLGDLPGPDDAARALQWAAGRGWPVVAEPFGEHGGLAVPCGSLLLTDTAWVDAHRPDRVVTVGRLTLSRHVAALLRHPGTRVETVSPGPRWTDPSHVVSVVHPLVAVAAGGVGGAPATGWREGWVTAGRELADGLGAAAVDWPSGLAVAATVLTSLPEGAVLFAASSNAARDLDLAPVSRPPSLRITASRGLAGIDGTLATAMGVALAGAGAPTYLLVGDLAFLHDSTALALGPGEPRPDLTVVLVNDDGGGIFGLLEPGDPARADLAPRFERVFGTPTGTDIGLLCASHAVPHVVADSAQALADELRTEPHGLRVVEVRVERRGHRDTHLALRGEARRVLGNQE